MFLPQRGLYFIIIFISQAAELLHPLFLGYFGAFCITFGFKAHTSKVLVLQTSYLGIFTITFFQKKFQILIFSGAQGDITKYSW
jgi:hypothetical protein